MNVTIIGASAGVGLLAVETALSRNHKVTALSRSFESISNHENLNVITGDATNVEILKRSILNAEGIIITLGTGKSTKPTTLYTRAAHSLIQAMNELQTDVPVIVLTGFGAGESAKYQSFFMKIIFSLMLKSVYENKTKMEEMIEGSNLRWEIVRPGMLNDEPFSGRYRVEVEYRKGMSIGGISRADVADFLINQVEDPTLLGKYPALSNK